MQYVFLVTFKQLADLVKKRKDNVLLDLTKGLRFYWSLKFMCSYCCVSTLWNGKTGDWSM